MTSNASFKHCLQAAQKISYAQRIFVCLSRILSLKSYQRAIKIFSMHEKNKKKTLGVRKLLRYV